MRTPTIHIEDNGPYQIKGSFRLEDDKENKYDIEGDISLCRCGYSDNKPFCDGTHEEIRFESAPRAEELMIEV